MKCLLMVASVRDTAAGVPRPCDEQQLYWGHSVPLPGILSFCLPPVQAHLPFAVIGSTEELKIGNKMMKARQYPWGTVQGE